MYRILDILKGETGYISGEEIGRKLDISAYRMHLEDLQERSGMEKKYGRVSAACGRRAMKLRRSRTKATVLRHMKRCITKRSWKAG